MNEISPRQLSADLRSPATPVQVVDVREPEEFAIANIGGVLIPLGELTQRHRELDPEKRTVVLCHHGVRSRYACDYLRSVGFKQVHNLSGGIDRWSVQVDSNVRRY